MIKRQFAGRRGGKGGPGSAQVTSCVRWERLGCSEQAPQILMPAGSCCRTDNMGCSGGLPRKHRSSTLACAACSVLPSPWG